jgi:aspartyl-tRNA(Asn)/glutamyl-tRNA(Gln) amidotransferase subunit A
MQIADWKKLGASEAIKKSLSFIEKTKDLNIVRSVDSAPEIVSDGLSVTYLTKDNITDTKLPTGAASKMLEGFVSPYEATVTRKLREAGAILIGKTNMDEFAMGSSTENSAYGPTKNPLNHELVPGGSSGGSAAAVAAGLVPFALGSDTGGSIRQPAAFCGVVGMMPTYGRVSRYGLLAMASSLDRIGTFTNTVRDAAEILGIIAGWDENDATTKNVKVPDYVGGLDKNLVGLRLGIAETFFVEGVDLDVAKAARDAAKILEGLGMTADKTVLEYAEHALPTYYVLQPAEVSTNLSRYDGIRYGYSVARGKDVNDLMQTYLQSRSQGFGEEVKRRILLGTYTLSAGFRDAYYDKAQKVRTLIKQDFDKAFGSVDVIISPTTPTTAFKLGERIEDPLAMYKADLLTAPASLAGLPAISIPCGMVKGMPVGLQIMGKQFDEETILRVAHAFEVATLDAPWRQELNKKLEEIRK